MMPGLIEGKSHAQNPHNPGAHRPAVRRLGDGRPVAAPLPDNCDRDQGTVTCTTFDGPGNNQAGVGTTDETETQGNTKNKSPEEPQDLTDECSWSPPNSQGAPNSC